MGDYLAFKHLAGRFIERNVTTRAGELKRQARQFLLSQVRKRKLDTQSLREVIRGGYDQSCDPLRRLDQLGTINRLQSNYDEPMKITIQDLFPSYASAVGHRSFPRPMRKASTSVVLPGNRPENRLGFGSTADFLNAATLW